MPPPHQLPQGFSLRRPSPGSRCRLPRREPGRGVVVVTHHLAALGAADEVVLLQPMGDGPATVWDRGTHEDLVGRNAVYAEAASEGVS